MTGRLIGGCDGGRFGAASTSSTRSDECDRDHWCHETFHETCLARLRSCTPRDRYLNGTDKDFIAAFAE
ncbi:MAG: hypothetical protein EBX99_08210 [Acidimicrobiia bacterium]|nr:hypothetical protein [Acidimicrobiia bacterium]